MNSIMRSSRFGCFTIVGIFLLEIPVPGVVASYNMEQDTCGIDNKDTISKLSLSSREKKKLNILSIDGGGSRGVMEAMLLDDVMRLVTLMKKDPQPELVDLIATMNDGAKETLQREQEEKEKRENNVGWAAYHFRSMYNYFRPTNRPKVKELGNLGFRRKLEEIEEKEVIHPTEIFDMIAGTSTGSLMAFALVAGANIEGQRAQMSIERIIEMYKKATPNIFHDRHVRKGDFKDGQLRYWSGQPVRKAQDGVKEELEKVFGDLTLHKLSPGVSNNNCIAAAVASEFNLDPRNPDKLEIFDTVNRDHRFVKVKDVLLASSDAPVYFVTPHTIGHKKYVDGGLTGNCPLITALPRLIEIYKDQNPELQTVISIAPPSQEAPPFNDLLEDWLKYFPAQFTDGYKVYMASKSIYSGPDKATFARASPGSEKAQTFKMDEINVDKMIRAIEEERIKDPKYYNEILDMAALTVSRLEDIDLTETFLKMIVEVVIDIRSRRSYDIAIRVSKNTMEKIQESAKESRIEVSRELFWTIQLWFNIGRCKQDQQLFQEAENAFHTGLEAIDTFEKKFEEDQSLLRVKEGIYKNIGIIKRKNGDYETAIENHDKSLNLILYLDGNKSPKYATTLMNKGVALRNLNKLEEAIMAYNESLEILTNDIEKISGKKGKNQEEEEEEEEEEESSPENLQLIAKIINNLGYLHEAKGDYDKALEHFEKSHELKLEIHGNKIKNKGIATSLLNIGRSHLNKKNCDSASKFLNNALETLFAFHESKDKDDFLSATIHYTLARCLMENKEKRELSKALIHADTSLQMRLRIFVDETHPNVVESNELVEKLKAAMATEKENAK